MWPFTRSRPSRIESQIMSALTSLQASVALNTTLTAQVVAALKAGTVGTSDADLAAVQASVDANNTALQATLSPTPAQPSV
jgi:hypothetical protein